MLTLKEADILRVWELGQGQPLWRQALLMLAPALPETSFADLARLSIGQRNAALFHLRKQMFGPAMEAVVLCPVCAETMEFTLQIDDFLAAQAPTQPRYEISIQDYHIAFRLPNSFDLGVVRPMRSLPAARQMLLSACILAAWHASAVVSAPDLPDAVLTTLAEMMGEQDSLAEIHLRLSCVQCDHSWAPLLDIVTFLWRELSAQAHVLLNEVHELASAYGWSEADILAMRPVRRKYYLGLVR